MDHKKSNEAVTMEDEAERTGMKIRTTKDWKLRVQWKDGSSSWITSKDMKNGYLIETAQYAVLNQLQDEPAFTWCVPYVNRKKKRIVGKLKSKYWERTHKYGVKIPKSVKEVYAIDSENRDTMWADAIREEMKKIKSLVRIYDGDPKELIG